MVKILNVLAIFYTNYFAILMPKFYPHWMLPRNFLALILQFSQNLPLHVEALEQLFAISISWKSLNAAIFFLDHNILFSSPVRVVTPRIFQGLAIFYFENLCDSLVRSGLSVYFGVKLILNSQKIAEPCLLACSDFPCPCLARPVAWSHSKQ